VGSWTNQINQIKFNQMQIFEERGKPEYVPGEKPLRAEKRTIKLNPHLTPSLEIEPGPHWWEASSLTTTPPLLCKVSHKWSRKRCIWRKALYRCCKCFFVCCLTHNLSGTSIPAASLCHLNWDVCTKNYINFETIPWSLQWGRKTPQDSAMRQHLCTFF